MPAAVGLVGHATAVVKQLNDAAGGWNVADLGSAWLKELKEGKAKNQARSADLANDRTVPMNYYCPLEIINKRLPRDAIVINEGSETMDIGRTVLQNYTPKSRLDAGTFGTMVCTSKLTVAISRSSVHTNIYRIVGIVRASA